MKDELNTCIKFIYLTILCGTLYKKFSLNCYPKIILIENVILIDTNTLNWKLKKYHNQSQLLYHYTGSLK